MSFKFFHCSLFGVAFSLSATSFARPTLVRLGFLGPDSPSLANGVSADGNTVVGFSNSPLGFQAFRWRFSTGAVGLGDLLGGSFSSQANACNADGTMVFGGSDDGNAGEGGTAFKWTAATGIVRLGDLGGPTTYGQGNGSSDNGNVVVGQSQSPSGIEAFRWTTQGGMVGLGDLVGGIFQSTATGVSGDGSVVCGYGMASVGQQPWRWTAGTGMVSIDNVGAALAVSHNGQVIVGWSGGNAVRWTPQGKQVLFQTMDRTNSFGMGCSADGNVIVGLANYSANTSTGEAFIWDPIMGARSLKTYLMTQGVNVGNVDLLSARAVSADGQVIVGYGDFGSGQEAWMVSLRAPVKVGSPIAW